MDGQTKGASTAQAPLLVELDPAQVERIVQSVPGGAENLQDIYPLTPLQEGMLFHHSIDGHGDTYVVVFLLECESQRRLLDLIEALQRVVDRHDVLRSAVLSENLPIPVQVVYRRATLPVEEIELDPLRSAIEQLREQVQPHLQHIDLRRAPLMRVRVAPAGASGQWYALLQIHHLVCDVQSMGVVISEVMADLEGHAYDLPEPVQYREHVADVLAHARTSDAESYFRRKFGDISETTAPYGILDVFGDGARTEEARRELDLDFARRLRLIARRERVSPATLFHAALALVIAGTTGRDDVVFGTVVFGRLHSSRTRRQGAGMFLNTLPLRIPLHFATSRSLVALVHSELLSSLQYEQSSVALAKRCSGIVGLEPLFTTVLNYRHVDRASEPGWNHARLGIKEIVAKSWSNYPVTVEIDDFGAGFLLTALVDRRVDSRGLLDSLMTVLHSLVSALERPDNLPALSLRMLPESELQQFASRLAAYREADPQTELLHELFEQQARSFPTAVALSYERESMSYAELNDRADHLAATLRACGVCPEDLVGLCVERGFELVVGILGILKAGGAYLPLDPSYPPERLAFILRDASTDVLVTQESLRGFFAEVDTEIVVINESFRNEPVSSLDQGIADSHVPRTQRLAYVIYTSGSTGNPKGVLVEHRQVLRLFRSTDESFRFGRSDVWSLFHSFAFDFSVWELWGALLYGGRLVIVPRATARSPQDFYELLCTERVTVLNQTPAAFAQLIDAQALAQEQRHALRLVIFGGEALQPRLLRPWIESNSIQQTRLINMYGITETTVHVTQYELTAAAIESEDGASPIGEPIPDLTLYLLDRHGKPVPRGITGEIYVGGAGVARGYLNRPELTAERFLADPFRGVARARMYRTGDVGRWRYDGTLEYLGRNDNQVKIRGHRIELGEIEAHLARHHRVKDALVVPLSNGSSGEKRLVAYIVCRQSTRSDTQPEGSSDPREAIVGEWAALYEETYGAPRNSAGPSFVGWNSSFTGEPIPQSQMQAWLESTLARIRALQPKKALEIGCGVGLLLTNLAPHCERYVGTDISAVAIENLRARTGLKHVELLHRPATQLLDMPSESFDTIILNSVVQYFPDVEYLLAVLRQAARLLVPGGAIFVGDVRNHALLPMFHAAVQLGKAGAGVSIEQLRKRVSQAVMQERELTIDPGLFDALPGFLPGVTRADIQLKRGSAINELTQYRYDVVLKTHEPRSAQLQCEVSQWQATVGSLTGLDGALKARRWRAVCLQAVPNARLLKDAMVLRRVDSGDPLLRTGELRWQLENSTLEGIDPEALFALAEERGYEVRGSRSTHAASECFDVELVDRSVIDGTCRMARAVSVGERSWRSYVNEPLQNNFTQQTLLQLREYLKERLPEYMIPAAWITLKQMPLTHNGKVDRRALPVPEARPDEIGECVPPQSELERVLAHTWAQVLCVDQVGVHDDFFELGGHSLLAMKLVARVAEQCEVRVSVAALFQCRTVAQLALLVDSMHSVSKQPATPAHGPLERGVL